MCIYVVEGRPSFSNILRAEQSIEIGGKERMLFICYIGSITQLILRTRFDPKFMIAFRNQMNLPEHFFSHPLDWEAAVVADISLVGCCRRSSHSHKFGYTLTMISASS